MGERWDRALVIGAGVMGGGIAAHLAGAGIQVLLIDQVPTSATGSKEPDVRNQLALRAKQLLSKSKPAALYDLALLDHIQVGNLEDDLHLAKQVDLVIEVVVERLDVKTALFRRLAEHVGGETIVASNTSGLSIAAMSAALPPELAKRFLGMHFFNPVRYMRLLELIPGPQTDPAVLAKAAQLGDILGKGVVYAKDTPNFVGNRIGVYSMLYAMKAMEQLALTIEQVDKIAGKPMGRPASAAFRTADLVGIDTLMHVAKNCYDNLPQDPQRAIFQPPEWIAQLIQKGALGAKTGSGFYKKEGADILVYEPKTGTYRPQEKVSFASLKASRDAEDLRAGLKQLIAADDKAALFAWQVLAHTLLYAASCVGEIADDIVNIDRAMVWGFNWELGPFATWDALGVGDTVARMEREGMVVPAWVKQMLQQGRTSFYDGGVVPTRFYDVVSKSQAPIPKDPRHISLTALMQDKSHVVRSNSGATLIDLKDGCLCFTAHTKMNTIDYDVIEMLRDGVQEAEQNFQALILANDGEHFGAGANLMLVFMAVQNKAWDQVETLVSGFQQGCQLLADAKVPVVAAPFQYTFGGALELVLACDAVQAHAEAYMGLVEAGVGLVPAGGGCLRLLQRYTDPVGDVETVDLLPLVGQASLQVAMAEVSTGAEHARRLRYLRASDGITLNREHLVYAAKQRALGLAKTGYRPSFSKTIRAAGIDAQASIGMRIWGMQEGGYASAHDALVARKVAHILCGGNVAAGTQVTAQSILDLEREAFLSLCGEEKTQARIQSILMYNKPLRN